MELNRSYPFSSFGYITATELSTLTRGAITYDKVTRFLSSEDYGDKHLWPLVNSHVRCFEKDDGKLIFDDTIKEKLHTDEKVLVCWQFDYCQGRSVKGINLENVLCEAAGVRILVNYSIVEKTQRGRDKKEVRYRRKSKVGKNEQVREMLKACVANAIKFHYVLGDSWYAAAETMQLIHEYLKRYFVMPVKSKRRLASSVKVKEQKHYQSIEPLVLDCATIIPLNQSSRSTPKGQRSVEANHKLLKGSASLAESSIKIKRTKKNHIFAAIYTFNKLELLRIQCRLNHFALRSKFYLKVLHASFAQRQQISL